MGRGGQAADEFTPVMTVQGRRYEHIFKTIPGNQAMQMVISARCLDQPIDLLTALGMSKWEDQPGRQRALSYGGNQMKAAADLLKSTVTEFAGIASRLHDDPLPMHPEQPKTPEPQWQLDGLDDDQFRALSDREKGRQAFAEIDRELEQVRELMWAIWESPDLQEGDDTEIEALDQARQRVIYCLGLFDEISKRVRSAAAELDD
jgi:hypothetical protein